MNADSLLILLLIFAAVALATAAIVGLLMPDRLRQRMAGLRPDEQSLGQASNPLIERFVRATRPLAKLSLPSQGWDDSPMRIRFMNAGWRSQSAPSLFFAMKTLLAFAIPLAVLPFVNERLLAQGATNLMLILVLSAGIGYYLPNAFLSRVIERRQQEIFENFPDALDLLTVSVEAGLGLDQAIAKVAEDIQIKSEILSHELQLVMMELRSGFSKEAALRHLALRTGVEEIDLLVAMLVQADRFGTSIGDSLRVHSDNLRTKRQQRAEEAAAKISVKLLIPLIVCIFPTLMVVLMGPAMIEIYRVLVHGLAGK